MSLKPITNRRHVRSIGDTELAVQWEYYINKRNTIYVYFSLNQRTVQYGIHDTK